MVKERVKMKTMATQKLLLSVGFLILAVVCIYLYYQSELHLFFPEKGNSNGLPRVLLHAPLPKAEVNPDGLSDNFKFVIKVLAYDRLESVSRCLQSLATADYVKDRVKLHIFIDHFKIEEQLTSRGSADIDDKLKNAHKILQFIDDFDWKHGEKEIHYRTQNAGLQAQWLEAWWPSSDDEFAFIVEDDMELSPFFYRYLRNLIATYYYDPRNFDPSIYGASLQRPRFVGGKHGNKIKVDSDTRLFLYQMVGTWGQLLFPKPWKEFRLWYDTHKSKRIKPILQGMVTTGWYKRMREKIWTPWFIKFIHSRGYYNIYTNFLLERALSVSYRDAGVNYGKKVGPDSYLINSSNILDINLWEMKPLKFMKWYDFCFQEVLPGRFVKSLDGLEPVLSTVHEEKRTILVNLFGIPEAIIRNFLCHFQKLGIHGYVLLGSEPKLLEDLARRGHAVIDAEQLINDMKTVGLVDCKESGFHLITETLVTAYIVKRSLQLGYSIWLTKGTTLPMENLFSILNDSKVDVIGMDTDEQLRTELLYFKSSVATIKLWNKVWEELASKAKSSALHGPLGGDDLLGFHVRSHVAGVGVRMKLIDASLITQLGSDTVKDGNTTTASMPKLLSWVPKRDTDYVKEHLKTQNMWNIDEELVCTSIICHQS